MPPPSRRFAVGDRVELSPGRLANGRSDPQIPPGTYTVARLMPWQGDGYHYRLKHARDQHERVASESQMRPA